MSYNVIICHALFKRLFQATKSGGRMVQVGLGEAHVKFPIINASAREVDVLGIMSNTHCTPLAVELVASGKYCL